MALKQDHFLSLFLTLSPPEVEQFATYIKSQFRESSQPILLFEHVRTSMQRGLALEDENFAEKMSPEGTEMMLDAQISTLFSGLNTHLKQFLFQLYLERNPIERELLYAQTMLHHEQKQAFEKHIKKAQNLMEDEPMSIDRHLLNFQVKLLNYFSPFTNKQNFPVAQVQQIVDELDEFYVSAKIKLQIELNNRQAILQEATVQNPFIDYLIQPNLYKGKTLTQFYRKIYTLFEEKAESSPEEITKIWETEIVKVSDPAEQAYLLNILLNQNARSINRGVENAFEVQYNLLSIGIKTKILTPNKVISAERFMNIINAACEIKRVDLAESLKKRWQKSIRPENYAHEVVCLAEARINFAKKEFIKVVELLRGKSFALPYCEYWLKCLLIRAKYELQEYDEAIKLCDNFLKALDRREQKAESGNRKILVGKYTEKVTKVFLRTIKSMANRPEVSGSFVKKVKGQEMAYKQWILEKLDHV